MTIKSPLPLRIRVTKMLSVSTDVDVTSNLMSNLVNCVGVDFPKNKISEKS